MVVVYRISGYPAIRIHSLPPAAAHLVRRRGKRVLVTGGYFASAEAAALSVARMPEAQVDALQRAAAE